MYLCSNETLYQSGPWAYVLDANRADGETAAEIRGYLFSSYGKEIDVPEALDGHPVRTIGPKAFEQKGMRALRIPDSVTRIGSFAFFRAQIGTIEIPGSVKVFGEKVFKESEIERVTIPGGVESMGVRLFGESRVKEIVLEHGVTEVPRAMCLRAWKTMRVVLPETIKRIGEDAFALCEPLDSLEIPPNVEEIGNAAFQDLKWKRAVLPKRVKRIGEYLFSYNEALEEVRIDAPLTAIERGMFLGCKLLVDVNMPKTVTRIGRWAFKDCEALESLVIPEGVKEIGRDAFGNCPKLTLTVAEGSFAHAYAQEHGLRHVLAGA